MRIEQRTVYVADDGTEFRFREGAQAHDRMLRLSAAFRSRVEPDVLADLREFLSTEINEALNQYIEYENTDECRAHEGDEALDLDSIVDVAYEHYKN